MAVGAKIVRLFRTPVLAPLLGRPPVLRALAVFGLFTLVMGWFRVVWMPCPVRGVLGIPCPGCGLTRACILILRGQFQEAMRMHAMAPIFMVVIAIFVVFAVLPQRFTAGAHSQFDRLERRTAIGPLLLAALFLYWIVRLYYTSTHT